MSAFIVNDYHINALVSYGAQQGTGFYWKGKRFKFDRETCPILAAELYSENVRSVNSRYNERRRRKGFVFNRVVIDHLSPSDIVSACDCLRYQSCETSDYERTLAWKITNAIREEAINQLIDDNRCWELYAPEGNRRLLEAGAALGTVQVINLC